MASKADMQHYEGQPHPEKSDFELVNENEILSHAEKRRLRIKLDFRLLPCIFIMYFINLLDRVSVGGSVAYGFRTDLGITGDKYNLGIALFYVFYCLAEVPSNLILKALSAKVWLPIIAILFGVTTLSTAFIHNSSAFLALRVLLGIVECGTLPGISYYLSTYYGRDELALRLPIFIAASPLASGVGSLLATAEVETGPITGVIYSWRNIFFINGLITFPVAIVAFFILPPAPQNAKMLSEKERNYIMTRSVRLTAGRASEEATTAKLVFRMLANPHVWFGLVPWFVAQILASSLTFFLSQILREQFHYSARQANLHVAYTFFFSTGLTPIFGYLADRTGKHAPFVLIPILMSIVGSAVFSYAENQQARYFGTFFANIGIFGGVGINTAWATSNIAPYTTRAAGTAFLISVGSLGGIVGAYVFLPSEAAIGYPTGAKVTLAFLAAAFVITCGHWFYCVWENKQRRLGKRDHRLNASPEEIELLGNKHPHFVLAT